MQREYIFQFKRDGEAACLKTSNLLNDRPLLGGFDFSDAELGNFDVSKCFVQIAGFSGATLRGARFTGADLEGVSFDGAILTGADFSNSHLYLCNAYGANFANANFQGARISGGSFCDVNFAGANLKDAVFQGDHMGGEVQLFGANFSTSFLCGATFPLAQYDRSTRFPPDFDPAGHGLIEILDRVS